MFAVNHASALALSVTLCFVVAGLGLRLGRAAGRGLSCPFDRNADPQCVLDSAGRILKANPALAQILGRSNASLRGALFHEIVLEEDRPRVDAFLDQVARSSLTFEFEVRANREEAVRWIAWVGYFEPEAGQFLLSGRDTTFRRLAADELFESEEKYRLVVENSHEVIFSCDRHGRWTYLNPAWTELTGFTVEETLGRPYADFVPQEDIDASIAGERKSLRDGRMQARSEIRVATREGSYRWVEASYKSTVDERGALLETTGVLIDLTERREAEEVLRRERLLNSAIVNSASTLICAVGRDLSMALFNDACQKATGYSVEEAARPGFVADLVAPEDLEATLQAVEQIFGDPQAETEDRVVPAGFENRWMTRSGETRLISWSYSVLRDANGNTEYIVGLGLDITEQRLAEDALRESQERFELAVRGSRDGLWDWDLVKGSVYFSPRCKEILGFSDHELPNQIGAWTHLVHPNDLARVTRVLEECRKGVADFESMEFRMRHKEGGYRWILARGATLRDEAGKPYRVAGSHTDVTERREVEESIRLSQARLIEAQNLARMGSWTYDLRTGEIDWSDELFRILGLDPDPTMTQEQYSALVHPEDFPTVAGVLERSVVTGENYSLDHRMLRRDGSVVYVSARGGVAVDESGQPIKLFGTMQDITERKMAEEELIRAREAALASVRLKSEFLANMSHEVRTPMNGVIGMTDLLLDTRLDADQRECAVTIRESATHLLRIINDILDFSKMEAGKVELDEAAFEVARLAEGLEAAFRHEATGKGLTLSFDLDESANGWFHGDASRLRQVCVNLIGNALKFTHEGGVKVTLRHGAGRLRLEVADTGIGIPVERQSTVFESFVQADGSTTRRYGGTGLGLAIVKQLVTLMGGTLGLHSQEGVGTMFWAEIPLRQAARAPEASPPLKAVDGGKSTHSKRVLIAEDNDINAKAVRRILEGFGATVDTAASGREALEMALAQPYDLILMDVQMPEMDGIEAVARLRQAESPLGKRTRVVAMTAHAMKGDRERCLEAGMDDYMTKPVDAIGLKAMLGGGAATPIFDAGVLEEISGGDAEFEQEIVATFLESVPDMMASLQEALRTGDGELSLRLAHTLKGSAKSVGANEFAEYCGRAELALRNAQPPVLEELGAKFDALRRTVEAHFARRAA